MYRAIPDLFHGNYCLMTEFVSNIEGYCVDAAHVRRLREQTAYKSFARKWNLPIYYQLRFQDIRSAFEDSLKLKLK